MEASAPPKTPATLGANELEIDFVFRQDISETKIATRELELVYAALPECIAELLQMPSSEDAME